MTSDSSTNPPAPSMAPPSSTPSTAPAAPTPLKMKDLCDATGLPRQAIHFYIQQGLLPAGQKTSRNQATYGEEHVRRLKLIKKLQHERFLPLRAIKALLDEQESQFSAAQRTLLLEVKHRFATSQLARTDASPPLAVDADDVCLRHGVERADVDRMIELGILGARHDDDGRTVLAHDDLWIVQSWGEIQRLGFAKELGFRVDDILVLQEVVQDLFNREALLLASRMERLPPDAAAALIERALPVVHSMLTGFHVAKIRNFFASLG